MKLIDISTRKFPNTFCKVDDADYDALVSFSWHPLAGHSHSLYVVRTLPRGSTPTNIRMHQQILGTREQIDHIDRDGLNNQRSNLRSCSSRENARNRNKQRNGKSKFKGVYWSKVARKWQAQIHLPTRITKYLGLFDCEGCAAMAYDTAARRFFGEFACLNFSTGSVLL